MVPVTSDLAGYVAYWNRTLVYVGVGAFLLLTPVYVLLYRLWRK